MAIGSSKIGVLGGKAIVPGGCVTFNSPGTFPVPVGINIVNLSGRGGAGNPGGNGNPGNIGPPAATAGGGGGGGGGASKQICICNNTVYQSVPGAPGGNSPGGGPGDLAPVVRMVLFLYMPIPEAVHVPEVQATRELLGPRVQTEIYLLH